MEILVAPTVAILIAVLIVRWIISESNRFKVLIVKINEADSGMSMKEKYEANQLMDETSKKITAIAEGYPELHSSENYRQLQDSIVDAEDHLQAARRVYNMNVSSFNQAITVFPSSIIANAAKHKPKDFFVTSETKREDVKMSL